MTDQELLEELYGIVLVLADEIYFQKCMYFGVPRLSESDKEECVDEAVKALPKFLETYARYSAALKDTSTNGARHEQNRDTALPNRRGLAALQDASDEHHRKEMER